MVTVADNRAVLWGDDKSAVIRDYVAPYLGRINDLRVNGHEDLVTMVRAIAGVGSTTRVLVSSYP